MIQKEVENLTSNAVFEAFSLKTDVSVEVSREKAHGDYSTSIALKIAKMKKDDPMDVAKKIVAKMAKSDSIEKTEILAPGFINFFVSERFLKKELSLMLGEGSNYGAGREGEGKTVVIDYSSPNIAKSFGIGHLRSTVIGQAVYNIYKFRGWNCIGDNHLGDWGTQFGKLIYQIKEKRLSGNADKRSALEGLTIKDLENLYVEFHQEAQNNPELEEKGRFWFERLESGDEEAKEIWDFCVKISLKEFEKIYGLLDVAIDYALGESFYLGMVKTVIEDLKQKGIAKESAGALIVDFSDKLPSLVAVKSDGATTYLVRDLAAIKYRIEKWNPDLFIYEVGADQSLYFRQLFKAAELLGWSEERNFIHMAHGLVRWRHGKFSTRKGDTIHLEEILKEAVDRAFGIIDDSETAAEISLEEKKEISKIVGIGAVKYNDLSQHHRKDIVFDWEKILNLKGNSGPYIQYTFARCRSVLRKSKTDPGREPSAEIILSEEEKDVLKIAARFPRVVKEAMKEFSPNLVCNFLFELSQSYNNFYNNRRIIQEEKKDLRDFRLMLTRAIARIIESGLGLMGIEAPDKM